MNFTKLQGAGNDFVLVETRGLKCNWSQLAVSVCDRRFGVGADGLILLMPSDVAYCRMRIFNADGSEAEACGNGLRCLVRYVLEKEPAANQGVKELAIETAAGTRKAKIAQTRGKLTEIRVSLGVPKLAAEDIPLVIEEGRASILDIKSMLGYTATVGNRKLSLNFVSLGNPHAIHFSKQPVTGFPLAQLGPRVEHHKMFPQRTNFEVARMLSRREIEVRVWERGVGETLACGSGAAAVAVAAQLNDLVDSKVGIRLPGGSLYVEWDGEGEVWLSGPAEIVFTGKWSGEV
ncbi:diaminopimelate epimerase [Chloroflexota bacterium]